MFFIDESKKPASEAQPVVELALTASASVYSYKLPIGTKQFFVQLRSGDGFKMDLGNQERTSLPTFNTIGGGGYWSEKEILINSEMYLNIQGLSNTQVAEIQIWK